MSRFDWDRVNREERIARARRAEDRLREELQEAILFRRSLVDGTIERDPGRLSGRNSPSRSTRRATFSLDPHRMHAVTRSSWADFTKAVASEIRRQGARGVLAIRGTEADKLMVAAATSRPIVAVQRHYDSEKPEYKDEQFRTLRPFPLPGSWWVLDVDQVDELADVVRHVAQTIWRTPRPEALLYDTLVMRATD